MAVRALRFSPLLIVTAMLAQAQDLAPAQDTIRVQVKEVIVPVTVTNAEGKFVTEMQQSDFEIYDQGKLQTITHFSGVPNQPVVVGFLLDLSSSSRTQWKNIQDAAIEMVYTLLPGDKTHAGYLIGYGNQAELRVDTTFNPDKIVDQIRKLSPSGGSAMNDAIYMACKDRKLVVGEPLEPRRVIVIIGDGHDNASSKTLAEVVELAQRNLITVYAINTESYSFTSGSKKNLDVLAEETGGRVEEPLQHVYDGVSGFLNQPSDFGNYQLKVGTGAYAAQIAKSLDRSVSNIAGEITLQYILHYIPDSEDDPRQKRNIEVKVKVLSNLTVRARTHYYPYAVTP
jgi:Ca-activated chloride channel family protein